MTARVWPVKTPEEDGARLFDQTFQAGQRALIWSILSRRSRYLRNLDDIWLACKIRECRSIGKHWIPICKIQGSAGRCSDFDLDFNPLNLHTQHRWLGIALAKRGGKTLPPVTLIQIGNFYFVEDGHHRISVAKAFGEKEVEAGIIVWDVVGTLPWEETRSAPEWIWTFRLNAKQAVERRLKEIAFAHQVPAFLHTVL